MEAEVVIHVWNGIKKVEYYGIHFNILSLEFGCSLLHSDLKASPVLRSIISLWTYSEHENNPMSEMWAITSIP